MRETDELPPEYDFPTMKGSVRGKFAAAYRQGTRLAQLDSGVAEALTAADLFAKAGGGPGGGRRL